MSKSTIIQGRSITEKEIDQIRQILKQHPTWSRTKISQKICEEWAWRNDKGRLKDIACRSLLRKLESQGRITLPAQRHTPTPRMKDQSFSSGQLRFAFLSEQSSASALKEATPLNITAVLPGTAEGKLFSALLAEYHYLGYKGSVGEHLAYLIRDVKGKLLACVLFGAAAWKTAPRDNYIGWQDEQIPHLASHILGRIAKRVSQDWLDKYGHGLELLETFVEIGRFKGTCYRAANWQYVGDTQGRSRNDRYSQLQVPIKQIYLYPLNRRFKEKLCN